MEMEVDLRVGGAHAERFCILDPLKGTSFFVMPGRRERMKRRVFATERKIVFLIK